MVYFAQSLLLLGSVAVLACSAGAVTPRPELRKKAAPPSAPEPLCTVLQPQFDRLAQRFGLGGNLDCEEVPGIVTLGQFGSQGKLDRSLAACIDDNAALTSLVQSEPAAVAGITYESEATTSDNGVVGLGSVAPWLPTVRASQAKGERLRIRLSIAEATWDTAPALSRLFEGQNHAHTCLPALCQDDASIAYKVLRGKVRVELTSTSKQGLRGGIELLGNTAGFSVDQNEESTTSVTLGSSEKLVLGVVAKPAKAELTDAKHCDGCGARGQLCCSEQPRCDEDLSCIEGACRPRGYPGAACDQDHCTGGAICVQGQCRLGCGAAGLACCTNEGCAEGLRCQAGQRARRDVSVFDDTVQRSGGFFGTDVDLDFGSGSCGVGRLRSRLTTLKLAGDSSHCDKTQWIATTDPNDCRVRVHMHISPFSEIRCRVQIFATEIDPSVPAPQALCR